MSTIGSAAGILGSAAGAPLSQTTGPATERSQKDSAAAQQQLEAGEKADLASGIGQTEEDQEADERDADGRRLWERRKDRTPGTADPDPSIPPLSKDATGTAGNALDLIG